jgi:hypothetical protein
MDDARQRRAAANETTVRDVNEAIERGQWPGEQDSPSTFRCECARLDCNQMIALTPLEYEQVRRHPRRFVLVPGHELAEIEPVVERHPGYVVVEKRGEAGELADERDPRS